MHWIYRILLRLYPREHRMEFGGEMLDVFTRIAEERRLGGRLGYSRFLAAEFIGLMGAAFAEWLRRVNFAPTLGGIAVAAVLHAGFYGLTSSVLRRVAAAAERTTVPSADPLAASLAVGLLGVVILLCLLPLFFLLSMRLTYRRR